METIYPIAGLAFFAVAALVMAVFMFSTKEPNKVLESRLDVLAGKITREESKQTDLLRKTYTETDRNSLIQAFIPRIISIEKIIEQADCKIPPSTLFSISIVLGLSGIGIPMAAGFPFYVAFVALPLMIIPWVWLFQKRSARLQKFSEQFPEALELLARALRSGQSLAAGLQVIGQEMLEPIGVEFGKAYERQKLGMPVEETLKEMCNRVPSLDLKFFATSVAIQKQTGGDLAEILDKIGYIVRERFKILGQVAALTGEGRMSGTVLLALPVALFIYLRISNPEYIEPLWTTEIGRKMLAGLVVGQILGAISIRHIVNIKV